MELIGLRVKHAAFGVGTITKQEGNFITVAFDTKITKFVYPNAFENIYGLRTTTCRRSFLQISPK